MKTPYIYRSLLIKDRLSVIVSRQTLIRICMLRLRQTVLAISQFKISWWVIIISRRANGNSSISQRSSKRAYREGALTIVYRLLINLLKTITYRCQIWTLCNKSLAHLILKVSRIKAFREIKVTLNQCSPTFVLTCTIFRTLQRRWIDLMSFF